MNKGKKLYEGKAKILYEGPEKGTAIQHFKDDATAFNNIKKSTVEGKGVLNNRISEHILNNINQIGIKTHLIKRLNMLIEIIGNSTPVLAIFLAGCVVYFGFKTTSEFKSKRKDS